MNRQARIPDSRLFARLVQISKTSFRRIERAALLGEMSNSPRTFMRGLFRKMTAGLRADPEQAED